MLFFDNYAYHCRYLRCWKLGTKATKQVLYMMSMYARVARLLSGNKYIEVRST